MTDRDGKYFNCSEEHELNYVSGKYKDKEKVKEFIREKCKDKTIHYWTQVKLAEYLAENGFALKETKSQTDLVSILADQFGSREKAKTAFNAVINCLADTLKSGDSISIKGFGTFKISDRAARKGINPRTGQQMEIAASKSVKFTPASALKADINNGE